MLVWDYLRPENSHATDRELSLWWHLGGESQKESGSVGNYQVQGKNGAGLQLEVQGGDIYCYSGDEDGPHGWSSTTYGEKVPITTLEVRFSGKLSHEFYTYIASGSGTISVSEKDSFANIISQMRSLIG